MSTLIRIDKRWQAWLSSPVHPCMWFSAWPSAARKWRGPASRRGPSALPSSAPSSARRSRSACLLQKKIEMGRKLVKDPSIRSSHHRSVSHHYLSSVIKEYSSNRLYSPQSVLFFKNLPHLHLNHIEHQLGPRMTIQLINIYPVCTVHVLLNLRE